MHEWKVNASLWRVVCIRIHSEFHLTRIQIEYMWHIHRNTHFISFDIFDSTNTCHLTAFVLYENLITTFVFSLFTALNSINSLACFPRYSSFSSFSAFICFLVYVTISISSSVQRVYGIDNQSPRFCVNIIVCTTWNKATYRQEIQLLALYDRYFHFIFSRT